MLLLPDSLPVGESLLVLIKEPLIVPYRRLLPQFRKSQTGRGAGVEGKEGEKEGCIYNKLRQVCTCLNIFFFSFCPRGEQINDSKEEHQECSSPFLSLFEIKQQL